MTDLVLEHLKKIQADISELKIDVRTLKNEVISVRTIMGEFIKNSAFQAC